MSRRDYTIMANTYTQIHIHFVFAIKYRKGIIHTEWKDDLYKWYVRSYSYFNWDEACTICFRFNERCKARFLLWINENKLAKCHFEWQEGYGAFSYSKSQIQNVVNYIQNQEEHHKKKTFLEEYKEFLEKFEVDFDERYIFKELIE